MNISQKEGRAKLEKDNDEICYFNNQFEDIKNMLSNEISTNVQLQDNLHKTKSLLDQKS